MPRPLTKNDIVERLHGLPLESYALIADVAKGITLGVGSIVLLEILAHLRTEWMRLGSAANEFFTTRTSTSSTA
jgi:hypothetical protein